MLRYNDERHEQLRRNMTEADYDDVMSLLKETKQEHLLEFWSHLNKEHRAHLLADIKYIDLKRSLRAFADVMGSGDEPDGTGSLNEDLLEPVPAEQCGSVSRCSREKLNAYKTIGLREIAEGHVAALLLAGGQGTRLGVPYPKGMYDVGLPSQKTLYQLQAERLCRLEHLAQEQTGKHGSIPWYIMTSEHTKEPTMDFFKRHNFFGLRGDNLIVFEQNLMPSFTFDGKIILETKSKLSLSPDGNGGLYNVLHSRGILEDMERRGIKYIHVYCVDNILVKMADPTFIGYSISMGAECAAKVVEKAFPTEAVGVVCRVGGKYQVVEYSELSLATAQKRNPDGRLTFNAGNICNHFFTVDFLKKVSGKKVLKYHIAKKKIPHVNAEGELIKPEKPNGVKLEMFVFDVFEFANKFVVWEVLREDEFSPLKNADGALKDTPTTARHALFDMHYRWILNAGGRFVDADGSPIALIPSLKSINGSENGSQKEDLKYENPIVCEISPLVSYDGEGLEAIVGDKVFTPPVCLNPSNIDGAPQNGFN